MTYIGHVLHCSDCMHSRACTGMCGCATHHYYGMLWHAKCVEVHWSALEWVDCVCVSALSLPCSSLAHVAPCKLAEMSRKQVHDLRRVLHRRPCQLKYCAGESGDALTGHIFEVA